MPLSLCAREVYLDLIIFDHQILVVHFDQPTGATHHVYIFCHFSLFLSHFLIEQEQNLSENQRMGVESIPLFHTFCIFFRIFLHQNDFQSFLDFLVRKT